MTTWHENAQKGEPVPEWPYPVNYGKVNEFISDVLVIGGGVAGVRAAISAAQNGAKYPGRLWKGPRQEKRCPEAPGSTTGMVPAPTPAPRLPPKSIPRQYTIVLKATSAGMLAIFHEGKLGLRCSNVEQWECG